MARFNDLLPLVTKGESELRAAKDELGKLAGAES